MIQPTTTVSRHTAVVSAEVGDTHVLLSDTLAYHGVEGTGLRIWELLEQPRTVDALVATLTTEYAVDEARCRSSVTSFVAALHERGLVALS